MAKAKILYTNNKARLKPCPSLKLRRLLHHRKQALNWYKEVAIEHPAVTWIREQVLEDWGLYKLNHQEEHHRKMDFATEWKLLLKRMASI